MNTSTRAVIVEGRRTPFIKAGTDFEPLDVLDLARAATVELLAALELDPRHVDAVILGNVARPVKYHNLAREVVLSTEIPRRAPAYTVSLACASACQAVTNAVDSIERGYAHSVIAGGAESLSNVPIQYSDRLARGLVKASQAKSLPAKVQSLASVKLTDLAPVAPGIRETSTGLTMGESAELMAKTNSISREAQDEFAFRSHKRAAQGPASGWLSAVISPTYVVNGTAKAVTRDNHIRSDTSIERLSQLRPVFDRSYGSITAGNSSPLTDGAAVLMMMSEDRARASGYRPKAAVRSYAYAAVDPGGQLLLGPAYAIPVALQRAGLELSDVDVFEMHEAFAAQVLSTTQSLASRRFAEFELGRSTPVGEIDPERLNIGGGSIALGHPFGATGARVLWTLAEALEREDKQFGLASVCAAGGIGCAIVLERAT